MSSKVTIEESPSPERGGEEGELWHVLEMAKKHHGLAMRGSWGLRFRFKPLLAVVVIVSVLVFFVSFNTRSGDGGGGLWEEAAVIFLAMEEAETTCDLFAGRWVYDNLTHPLYLERRCRFMSDQSACEKFGRENLEYQYWRWKPHGCDLPRNSAICDVLFGIIDAPKRFLITLVASEDTIVVHDINAAHKKHWNCRRRTSHREKRSLRLPARWRGRATHWRGRAMHLAWRHTQTVGVARPRHPLVRPRHARVAPSPFPVTVARPRRPLARPRHEEMQPCTLLFCVVDLSLMGIRWLRFKAVLRDG